MGKFSLFGFLLLAFMSYGLPASSQTPDGITPARESVCDPLKAGGVTKGLYGLCVAFCEAHDAADLSVPLTKDNLAKLIASKPNGQLLQKYNDKKQASDPDMPCLNVVVTENACPCWTEGQIVAADGRPDYSTVNNVSLDSSKAPPRLTELGMNGTVTLVYLSNFEYTNDGTNGSECIYRRIDMADFSRWRTALFGTNPKSPGYSKMTDLQAAFCSQQLGTQIDWVNSADADLSQ